MTATTDEDPRWAAVRARDARMAAKHALLTVPPCPDWCTDTFERDKYDSVLDDDHTFVRSHSLYLSRSVSIEQEEHNCDNIVTLCPAVIQVEVDSIDGSDKLDADGARALASELVAAAFKLDEIRAAQQ